MSEDLAALLKWREYIEPEADVMGGDEFAMRVSQTISATRTADALEKIADALERIAKIMPLMGAE